MIHATLACEPIIRGYPLPSESEAPVIGPALAATLIRAIRPKGRFLLKRYQSGAFDCSVISRNHRQAHANGGLLGGCLVEPAEQLAPNPVLRESFGVPRPGGPEATAVVLLLRLCAAMAVAHLHFEIDFRPAADSGKRYRLILHAASGSWLYLHASSLEHLLRTGLDFCASSPTVAHKHP